MMLSKSCSGGCRGDGSVDGESVVCIILVPAAEMVMAGWHSHAIARLVMSLMMMMAPVDNYLAMVVVV